MNLNFLLSPVPSRIFRRPGRFTAQSTLCTASLSLLAACALFAAPNSRAATSTAAGETAQPAASTSGALVDAPSAVLFSSSAAAPLPEAPTLAEAGIFSRKSTAVSREAKLESEAERNAACEHGTLRGKPCRVSWPRVLGQSFFFLSAQHLGNIAMDSDTRSAISGNIKYGTFWSSYVYCVEHYRWSRWKDDDPFGVDYIGHPMMGAVTSSIYEQNDPKQRALTFENTRRYWNGRLRAMAYSAAYSAQWKVGPLSEASIGNTGRLYYYSPDIGRYTNETGMQDFFMTPIGGLAWNVGEDIVDRYIMTRVRHKTRNRLYLLGMSLTMPGRSAGNVARFRAPYYRDSDVPSFVAATPAPQQAAPAPSDTPSEAVMPAAAPANTPTPNL